MEYYIQGNAAKAKQIKAAFEELGYNTGNLGFTSSQLYYTIEGKVELMCTKSLQNLIKTHPDYKELELPVEPKFKVGDKISWINHDCDTQTITDIRDGSYITVDKHGVRCALKFAKQDEWELVPPKPHYDIKNFKPFDKVLTRDTDCGNWNVNLFSYYIDDEDARVIARFRCINYLWAQCIPFNDDTKHLLGTTDMCDEIYINW